MISAASVKDRLKKQAIKDRMTMQNKLVTFGLERTIYRISISPYAERFTLKGGIFLYGLFEGQYARATMDIDLLAGNISNNATEMQQVFEEIFSITCDDAIRFDTGTLKVTNITEFKIYHGINISIFAYLDRTRIPVSIDIGFGDVIFPNRIQMDFPVLLDMKAPKIYAYSIYSAIAEKFEACVSLGVINSRYKDFYDIYLLASTYNLDGMILMNAIIETFGHRGTGFDDIVIFENNFAANTVHQKRWTAFIDKKKVRNIVDFETVVDLIKILLFPITSAIRNHSGFLMQWDKSRLQWSKKMLFKSDMANEISKDMAFNKDHYDLERSIEAMKKINVAAEINGTSEMTLDEINEEISQYRKQRREVNDSEIMASFDAAQEWTAQAGYKGTDIDDLIHDVRGRKNR